MGYKNGQVASDRFRQIKKKLGWGAGVRVKKGTTSSKSNVAKARAPAKPRAAAAKKPAGKKAAPAIKGRAPAKKLPKYVEEDDDEEGNDSAEEEKPRDLMAPSDDDNDQGEKARDLMAPSDSEADKEMSMQDKVARGDFDSHSSGDGELQPGAVDMINCEMAEKELQNQIAQEAGTGGEPVYEEYDAYDADEALRMLRLRDSTRSYFQPATRRIVS